jgi:outer membrane protein
MCTSAKSSFKSVITGILLIFLTSGALVAQDDKYGFTNLGNLLDVLPETKVAEKVLNDYADSLSSVGIAKSKAFEEAYATIERKYSAGQLTPQQIQQAQVDLERQQRELQAFDKQAQEWGAQRRNELLAPILDRVLGAISEVAREGGYLMVFDTSSGALLFADEAWDITADVNKKLGI